MDLINDERPHILALTEFGASQAVTDNELGVIGYTLYRGDHTSGNGGPGRGAALYVNNSLNHSGCPKLEDLPFDCSAWCTVKLSNNKLLLAGVVYRSPNSEEQNNKNLLEIMRRAAEVRCDYFMLCGDYNLPLINWSENRCLDSDQSFTAEFVETILDLNLFQHVRDSTRFRNDQNSCLDLIFTNEEEMINEVKELPPLGKSDHVCQKWELIVEEILFRNTTVKRPNFRRANWERMKEEMRDFQFDPKDAPSIMNDKFVAMIGDSRKRHIPLCKPRSDKYRLPWMGYPRIKKQRSATWRSWKAFKQSSMPRDYAMYKTERNRLKDMTRTAKRQYEQRLIGDMRDNPNLYHGHCRRTLKTKQGVSNVIDGKGELTKTEEETAVALNSYYQTVFTHDNMLRPLPVFPAKTEEKLSDIYISEEMVEKILSELKPNKAAGPDGVESRILKECSKEMAPHLQKLFSRSMEESEVPEQWKKANIVPIHKKGSRSVMANFRPVALTSIICKVLEKVICVAIMSFLVNNNLISGQQHGFVKGRSCQTNILLCLERWTEMVDQNMGVDVAYFDYAKAFDKVSHRLLILKLKAYGIDGKLLLWLEDYLRNRHQRVIVGNAASSWLEVLSGTTQGTVLGFLLFLIFINDLPAKCTPDDESLIMLLADDTKTFQAIGADCQAEDQRELQGRINAIAQWADEWSMEINATKSKIMHIGKNNPGLPYFIDGTEIAASKEEKDIGFWVTDDLSNSTHVHKARCKALGEISRIRRNFSYIDKRAFCILYNQRVRPHLDYGMAACPPNTCAEAKLMEAVQSKATALVQGMRGKSSEERRKELGLMKLEERRERGDLIEVFKILNGLTRINPREFWEVRDARNGVRLVKELAPNGRRQRQSFFSYRVVQKWNLLPTQVKNAPSLNVFKNRLDDIILGAD